MKIIKYCRYCGHVGAAGNQEDTLFCTKCRIGEPKEQVFSEKDSGVTFDDIFSEFIVPPNKDVTTKDVEDKLMESLLGY